MSDAVIIANAILGFLSTALTAVLAYLAMKLNAAKTENKELVSREKSNERIRDEAVGAATEMANYVLRKDGKPPIVPVAPVVAQSNSPSTEKQRKEADIATAVAKLAAAKLAVGLEPSPEPERADEPGATTSGATASGVAPPVTVAALADALAPKLAEVLAPQLAAAVVAASPVPPDVATVAATAAAAAAVAVTATTDRIAEATEATAEATGELAEKARGDSSVVRPITVRPTEESISMSPTDLKALKAKFKTLADDKPAVGKLADETKVANPTDTALHTLCDRLKAAADGDAVRAILDE